MLSTIGSPLRRLRRGQSRIDLILMHHCKDKQPRGFWKQVTKSYHDSVFKPSTSAKCVSRVTNVKSY